MVALPDDGTSRPARTRKRVVFPAPFGPSRPVTPGPKEQSTSDTATFAPNHFDRRVATTVASSTWRASVVLPGAVTSVSGSANRRGPC